MSLRQETKSIIFLSFIGESSDDSYSYFKLTFFSVELISVDPISCSFIYFFLSEKLLRL